MNALSVMQPHAILIIGEEKRCETRGGPPPNGFRGRIAIHASKSFSSDLQRLCWHPMFAKALLRCGIPALPTMSGPLPDKLEIPRGVILGTADLYHAQQVTGDEVDYLWRLSEQEKAFGNFAVRRWVWFLRDVVKFPKPIPASGQLGLWRWDPPDSIKNSIAYGLPGNDFIKHISIR